MILSSLSKSATKALLRNITHLPTPPPAANARAYQLPLSQNGSFSLVARRFNLTLCTVKKNSYHELYKEFLTNYCHTCKVNQSVGKSVKGSVTKEPLGSANSKLINWMKCVGKNATGRNQSVWQSQKGNVNLLKGNGNPVKGNVHQQSKRNTGLKMYNKLGCAGKNTGKMHTVAKTYSKIIHINKYSARTMIQRVSSVLVRLRTLRHTRVRLGRMILGSVFLSPPVLFPNDTGKEKTLIPEIPKEQSVRKSRGALMDFLMGVYEVVMVWVRALKLAVTFVPILMLYPVTYLGKGPTEAWWLLLLKAIELSGPILIKLGQWMSTRRDIFPDACCSQFSRLQHRITPHSWHFTAYRMRRAFGPHWRKIFVKFDNHGKPIGSGCVAQVYKVWMNADYIPDEQLVEEILSEMDDSPTWFEGMEVLGFGDFFYDKNFDMDEAEALTVWREQRDVQREREREEERQRIKQREEENLEKDAEAEAAPAEGSILNETDMITIVENVASELLSGEEQTMTQEAEQGEEEEPSLSLVEEWQEGPLDKSLPVEEAPPDDLEGLVPVAIKVLHPGVVSAFRRDLRILRFCAWLLSSLWPPLHWLSLPQCVNEFAQVMEGQINLKKEAEHLEIFSENFSDIQNIKFPRPLRPYVTNRVLVETYEEGDNMLDVLLAPEEEVSPELRKNLAQIGVDALLKMVFTDNLVHGDLHPGNILVQNRSKSSPDGSGASGDTTRIMMVDVGCDTFVIDVQPDPNPLRLCILDCGVVSRLSETNLSNIRAVFKQVVLGDGESVAELFLDNSIHQCPDPEAFKAEISDLVDCARAKTISLGQVDVGVLLQNVLSVLLRHRVRLESAFSAVVLAIFVLEGLGRTLDPDMDILERTRPVLVTGKVT